MTLGFTKSKVDSNLYLKVEGRRPVMLVLYVDDMFVIGEEATCHASTECSYT